MRIKPLLGLVSLLLLVVTGCGSGTTSSTPAPPTPVTGTFSASPTTVVAGSSSTLTWQTANASSVTIDQGIGKVAASGTLAVTPTATTTYTLTGTGASGTTPFVQTATVTVSIPALPTATFSAAPLTIQAGQSTTLTWSTANASTVTIDQGVGTVAASGSKAVSPTQTTTYTLTASNGSQSVTQTVTVTVQPVQVAPTIQFSASPATIQAGANSTLSWTVQNATTVSIDQGVGTVASSGKKVVSPAQTTTYTLTATGGGQTVTGTTVVTVSTGTGAALTGVLNWKGSTDGLGLYNETTLVPANVVPAEFGKIRAIQTDGEVLAQPLYVRQVDMGANGVHDLILMVTEHDSVIAYDGLIRSNTPLWQHSFLDASDGVTTQADNHGGRSQFGGEIGITGTPAVDPKTGILYVVAATQQNSVVIDTLHEIDIRTGNEVNGTGVVVTATVPGTGLGSVNGQITFAPAQENQRPGLVLNNGVLYVAFGSFSDWPPYHGWLYAYDPATLRQIAVFNSSPNFRADYDMGSAAAFWNGGAAPSFESDGSFYIVAADGSTDWQTGGGDYGDTVLHMKLVNGQFQVLDKFTPFNRDCIDRADLEMGSGGFTILPAAVGGTKNLGVVMTKEGRLYLLDRSNLGGFNATTDQVVQQFMVGNHVCDSSSNESDADGPVWNRLYGDASYWNGNLYMAASNETVNQYAISNGMINPTPVAVGATTTGPRGANTAVSANGATNAIVWAYEKNPPCSAPNTPAGCGLAILHAYDATNISNEIWNSNMNITRDALNTGAAAFQVPVVIDGKVIVTAGHFLDVYTLLP